MTIILSHTSALYYWRRFTGNIKALRPSPMPSTSQARPKLTDDVLQELAALQIPFSERRPLHVLIPHEKSRARLANIREHITSRPLPAGAILKLTQNIHIVCPELCYLQLAQTASPGWLAFIGTELCGTYALGTTAQLIERAPLTTTHRLEEFAHMVPELKGTRLANRITPHVFDNAASPMEAKLALLLCLPNMLGGYGLPRPALNRVVPLSPCLHYAPPKVSPSPATIAIHREAVRTR